MELKVNINREDYLHYTRHILLKKGMDWKLFSFLFVITGTILVTIPIISSYFTSEDIVISLSDLGGKLAIFSALFYILHIAYRNRVIDSSEYIPHEKGCHLGEYKISILDEGFKRSSDIHEQMTNWRAIKSVEKDNNSIYLLLDQVTGHIVPKRSFDTEEAYKAFYDTVLGKVEQAKRASTNLEDVGAR